MCGDVEVSSESIEDGRGSGEWKGMRGDERRKYRRGRARIGGIAR